MSHEGTLLRCLVCFFAKDREENPDLMPVAYFCIFSLQLPKWLNLNCALEPQDSKNLFSPDQPPSLSSFPTSNISLKSFPDNFPLFPISVFQNSFVTFRT
ncbi:unnamed protein product [Moneuplotes crassus]|uniref:Uncharacterized protein n=1 Tax=Euplotes crassus TaxID=5936 RepID=A0AAD2D6M9_EUPCR|nr:unnamed protein product [Moneuplotes crassus]